LLRCDAVLDDTPGSVLRRLTPLKPCFGHRAEPVSLGAYVSGLLSDSPRKSTQAMLARVTAAPAYHAVQHFITNAPWSAARMWRALRSELPEHRGLLLDDTGFAKKGTESVGVARQYSGTLGKIGNCQVAVTAALWTGVRAWLVAAAPYLPESWASDSERCARAHVPQTVRFRKKWEMALHLLQQVRASGITITGVLSDSGYGDATSFRTALHRLKLPHGLGISGTLTVFLDPPQLDLPGSVKRPRLRYPRATLGATAPPVTVKAVADAWPAEAWDHVTWQNGDPPARGALCAAVRITPAQDWKQGRLLPEIWLLLEPPDDRPGVTKYYFVHLLRRTALARLVQFVHQRWPIEQQCQQLKTELGLDHFERRTYPGWHHHVVVSAVAYAFLQHERMQRDTMITFEAIHAIVQEIFAGLLFASCPRCARWLEEARQLLPLRL